MLRLTEVFSLNDKKIPSPRFDNQLLFGKGKQPPPWLLMQRKGRGYWSGIVGRIPIRCQDLVWRAWLEIFQFFHFQEEEEAVSCKSNFPESHILNPSLTKFVRSRWLDIGLVLFLWVYGPRRIGHAKKELGQYPAILSSHLVNNPYILHSFPIL